MISIDQALALALGFGGLPVDMSIWALLYDCKDKAERALETAVNKPSSPKVIQSHWNRIAFCDQRIAMAKTLAARLAPEYTPDPNDRRDTRARLEFLIDKNQLADILYDEFALIVPGLDISKKLLAKAAKRPQSHKRLETYATKLELCIGLFIDYFADKGKISYEGIADRIDPSKGGRDGKDSNQTRRKLFSACYKARKNAGYGLSHYTKIDSDEGNTLKVDKQWVDFFEKFPPRVQKKVSIKK